MLSALIASVCPEAGRPLPITHAGAQRPSLGLAAQLAWLVPARLHAAHRLRNESDTMTGPHLAHEDGGQAGGACQPVHGRQGGGQQCQPVQHQPPPLGGEQRALHGPDCHGHQHAGCGRNGCKQPGGSQRLQRKVFSCRSAAVRTPTRARCLPPRLEGQVSQHYPRHASATLHVLLR